MKDFSPKIIYLSPKIFKKWRKNKWNWRKDDVIECEWGGGWGEMVRPCRKEATPLLVYRMETDSVDIDVSGNVFEEAPHGLVYCNAYDGKKPSLPGGYRIHDNVCKKIGPGKEKTR